MNPTAWLEILGIAASGVAPNPIAPPDVEGAFDHAPVVQWIAPLPGPRPASASHTERGAPVLHGDFIYLGTAGDSALYVLNRRDGSKAQRIEVSGPVQAAPVIVGDRIFFADSAGYSWCYSLDGKTRYWSHFSGAPVLSSPTVVEGRVYVANVDNLVYCLSAENGELIWRHAQKSDPGRAAELELYGAPAPILSGNEVLTGHSDGTLVAIDTKTGEVAWQRRVGEGRYPDIIAEPLVVGGDAIVSGYTEPLMALDTASRNVRWRVEVGGAQPPTRAGERNLYHGGVDGVLRSVDAVTGAVAWEWDSETSGALTSPVVTEAGLLVASSSGTVYLVDRETGELSWELQTDTLLAGITAPPAVEGRQAVVVTNAGNVISLVVSPGRSELAASRAKYDPTR